MSIFYSWFIIYSFFCFLLMNAAIAGLRIMATNISVIMNAAAQDMGFIMLMASMSVFISLAGKSYVFSIRV